MPLTLALVTSNVLLVCKVQLAKSTEVAMPCSPFGTPVRIATHIPPPYANLKVLVVPENGLVCSTHVDPSTDVELVVAGARYPHAVSYGDMGKSIIAWMAGSPSTTVA